MLTCVHVYKHILKTNVCAHTQILTTLTQMHMNAEAHIDTHRHNTWSTAKTDLDAFLIGFVSLNVIFKF